MLFVGTALLLLATPQRTDTIVLRGSADIPPSAVRSLVSVWKAGEGLDIGDVRELAVAPDGRVYLWDPQTPALLQLGANGAGAVKIGRKGAGPGEYDRLNGIAVRPDGKLIAWDGGNSRLNVYGPDGRSQGTWLLIASGRQFTFAGLTATLDNRVLMRTTVRLEGERIAKEAFVIFDQAGVVQDTVFVPQFPGDPWLTAQSPNGRSSSSRYLPYGTSMRFALSPLGHAVSGPGRPYVVHTVFNGRPIRIERTMAPVSVSRDERDKLRAEMEASMRRMQPNWTWTGPDVPATKPAYGGFMIGSDGRIWVQLSVESEKVEPEPARTTEPNPLPVVPYREKERRWDVYEPDGRFVARVAAPRAFTAHAARGDTVWGVMRDGDDVPTVMKMRIAAAR